MSFDFEDDLDEAWQQQQQQDAAEGESAACIMIVSLSMIPPIAYSHHEMTMHRFQGRSN